MVEYIKIAVFFSIGVYIYECTDIAFALIFLLSLIMVLTVVSVFKHKFNTKILVMMTALVMGTVLCNAQVSENAHDLYKYEGRYVTAVGRVCEIPQDGEEDENVRYVIDVRKVNNEKVRDKILLTSDNKPEYGDTVAFSGFINELPEKLNRNGFDYKKYYKKLGIFFKSYSSEVKLSDEVIKDYSPYAINNSFKNSISKLIDKHYKGDYNAIMKAVLIGDKKEFSDDFDKILTKTGTKRYFYSSYLHIMLLMSLITLVFGIFKKRTRDILTVFLLIIYAFANANNTVSVRLAVMIAVIIFTESKFGRKYYPDIVGITLLAVGAANPIMLFDAGFVMSVLSAIMIYYFYDCVHGKLKFIHIKYIRRLFAIGIICTIGLLPVSAYFFGAVSIYSIVLSIIMLPCVTVIMVLAPILLVMLALFNTAPLFKQAVDCVLFILKLVPTISYKLGLVSHTVAKPNLLLLIIYTLAVASGVKYIKKKNSQMRIAIFVAAALMTSYVIGEVISTNNVEITFVNVGQGDGAVIQAPYRFNVLIDGGGGNAYSDYNPGETVYLDYLETEGITKADSAFVSHYHQDHVQGIIAAMENIKVRNLFLPDNMEGSEWRVALENTARENGTTVHYISQETLLTYNNGMTIRIIPPSNKTGLSDDENDTSYVYYVEYNGFSATFTGDMSSFAEKNLIDDGKASKTNLLKVAHHGSNTATCEEWVEKLTPEYAVISVGENNPYNLPNDDVLERLKNTQVFRTDYDGDIKFIIHKNGSAETDIYNRR